MGALRSVNAQLPLMQAHHFQAHRLLTLNVLSCSVMSLPNGSELSWSLKFDFVPQSTKALVRALHQYGCPPGLQCEFVFPAF